MMIPDEEFTRMFWAPKFDWRNSDTTDDGRAVARINHCHFIIGEKMPPGTPSHLKGHGGSQYTIEWTSGPRAGQTVVTDNLWTQGGIPQEYWDALPDNAKFRRD